MGQIYKIYNNSQHLRFRASFAANEPEFLFQHPPKNATKFRLLVHPQVSPDVEAVVFHLIHHRDFEPSLVPAFHHFLAVS